MQDFRKLKVWEKAHQLTLEIYRLTAKFPREEVYALTSQTRRASTSIGLNIVEGCGRFTKPDFKHFLVMATGSVNEVDYAFILAHDLGYITNEEYNNIQKPIEEVRMMLISLINKI